MNERPAISLREAMRNANLDELDEAAEEVGRQAVAVALAEPAPPYKPAADEDRQRLLDAALMDACKAMEHQRDRLGRRVTSIHDAKVMRQIFELLRSMAGTDGGSDGDPSFQ